MNESIKFDFSPYTAAIRAISAIQDQSESIKNSRIAKIADDYGDFADDRHYCRECLNIRNGFCIKQRFRPVDNIPRRCEDFVEWSEVDMEVL